jgi:hypothetical protein
MPASRSVIVRRLACRDEPLFARREPFLARRGGALQPVGQFLPRQRICHRHLLADRARPVRRRYATVHRHAPGPRSPVTRQNIGGGPPTWAPTALASRQRRLSGCGSRPGDGPGVLDAGARGALSRARPMSERSSWSVPERITPGAPSRPRDVHVEQTPCRLRADTGCTAAGNGCSQSSIALSEPARPFIGRRHGLLIDGERTQELHPKSAVSRREAAVHASAVGHSLLSVAAAGVASGDLRGISRGR